MKKSVLKTVAIVSLLGMGAAAFAMEPHGGDRCARGGEGHRIERMTKVLDLTEAQVAEVKAIMANAKAAQQANREQMKSLRQALKKQPFVEDEARAVSEKLGQLSADMAYQRAATKGQIYAVLDDEQRTRMEALADMREKRRDRR